MGLLPLAQHRPSVEVRRLECGDELGDEHSVWKILCAILEWAARVSQSVSMRNAPWVSGELRASPCASSASTHCASPALDNDAFPCLRMGLIRFKPTHMCEYRARAAGRTVQLD